MIKTPAEWVISACTLGHTTLDSLLPAISENDFQWAQLWLQVLQQQGYPMVEVAQQLREFGIQVDQLEGVFAWAQDDEAAAIAEEENVFSAARELGASAVLVADMTGGQDLAQLKPRFTRLCRHAAEYDIDVRLEFLPWSSIPDLEAALSLLDHANAPNAGLILDSWHVFRTATPLEAIARLPGKLIKGVQINDTNLVFKGEATAEETMEHRTWPGEGYFDLAGFIHAINATGSNARVSVELINFPAEESPSHYAASARDALARLFA